MQEVPKKWWPINRWKLSPTSCVIGTQGNDTPEQAEAEGRASAAKYGDHTYDYPFFGTLAEAHVEAKAQGKSVAKARRKAK